MCFVHKESILYVGADVNEPAYYGLVSNVAGRTPDLVMVPLPGVVFASPSKKLSEHGGILQPDVNVALMVYAPNLATAGTIYNETVSTGSQHHFGSTDVAHGMHDVYSLADKSILPFRSYQFYMYEHC